MSRGHRAGHHSSADETLALQAIQTADLTRSVLLNNTAIENAAPIGPASPVVFDSAPFTSLTGKVKISATMSVTGTGGTSVATESVQYQLRVDGAPLATPLAIETLGAGHIDNEGTLVWKVTGLAPGPHTFGIQANNITTPGHTLVVPTGGAVVVLADSF